MLLSFCAGAIVEIVRSEANDVKSGIEVTLLQGVDDSAIKTTLIALTSPDSPTQRFVEGTPRTVTVDDQDVVVVVSDENGKVDLNFAPRPTLIAALKAVGLSLDTAEAGADKILDWRESGLLKRLNGAKYDDYNRASYTYAPRQGAFRSVGELELVMSFNVDLLTRLEPMLTVFSQDSEVDITTASPLLVAALQPNSNSLSLVLPNTAAQIPPLAPKKLAGHAFTIQARARFKAYFVTRTAVVRLSGNSRQPIWVYRWD